ncbi:hypothetical protein I4U23_013817 [Adineta vaga]|nr:hypothetical protein I4U23_013817 [Adineta vaga]
MHTNPTQFSSDPQSSRSPDRNTRTVINELKYIIGKPTNSQKIDESFIEKKVFEIRANQRLTNNDLNECRRSLSDDLKNCSDEVLKQALAYGDDSCKFKTILTEKFNKDNSSGKSLFINPSSLENLKRDLKRKQSPNLFHAVLNFDDKEINRADRMFYSEAHRLVKNLTGYTFDNAHDQVQAIRLTHYQSDNDQELRDLIQQHRTFDDAYSYLRRLPRNQASSTFASSRSSNTPYDSHSCQSGKTIIKKDDYVTNSNAYSSNSSPSNFLVNSSSTQGRSGSTKYSHGGINGKETSC